jgi:hypothetical protein
MANGETPDPKKQKAFNQEQKQTIQNQKELNTEGAAFQELLDKFSEKHTGINKSIQGYLSAQEDITGQLQQQLKATEGNKEGLKGSLQLSRQVQNAIKNSIGPYDDINKIQKEQAKNLQLEAKLKMQSNKLFEEAGKSQGDYIKEMNEVISNDKERAKIADELAGVQDKELGLIADIRSAQLAGNTETANSLTQELSLTNEKGAILSSELGTLEAKRSSLSQITSQEAKENLLLIETQGNLEGANSKLKEQLDKQLAINKAMGLTGGALKTVNKLLGGALGNTDEILKNSQDQIEALVEQRTTYDEMGNVIETGAVSKMEGFGIQIMNVGKSIKGNLSDPLLYLKIGLDFNKQVTELQKNMGLTRGEAAGLRHEFSIMAASSGEMAINSKEIQEAFAGLNKEFGTASSVLRKDIVTEAAKLMKLTGQSSESVAAFAKYANISGKPMKQITAEARRAVVAAEKEGGVRLDINKTLDEAGKVGGQISAQLGGNPAKIAKAVALTKQFGMELEAVAATSKALLDFESNIEAELEAELLTGKQLNLEKARLAALTGDYETLTKEINEQVGTFADFSKMNILQQDALAKSLGMTSDQLSDQLLQKANLEELAEEARAGGDEELAQQLERRSAEEKFQDAVVKLKGIFADLVGGPISAMLNIITAIITPIDYIVTALGSFFDVLTGGNSELTVMQSIIGGIAVTWGIIVAAKKMAYMWSKKDVIIAGARNILAGIKYGWQLATNRAKAKENRQELIGVGRSVAVMVAKVIKSFSSIPVVGAIIGAAVGLGLAATVYAMSKKTGDLASKGTGGPMVMTSPQEGGLYQGTPNDQVLMSPTAVDDAMKPKETKITTLAPPPPPKQTSETVMNEKMDALIEATTQKQNISVKSTTSTDLWAEGNPNSKGSYQESVLNETDFA